ncbi:MAG: dihydroorotase [Candidatus Saccharibacteria bacterium]|nr:dihydroorotase [Candidatus Saccharibacteria bacterium]
MVLLIQHGTVVNPAGKSGALDILVEDGKVVAIEPKINEEFFSTFNDVQVIDAKNCVVAPGLVDVHVHFRDPGFTHKEDIITGAEAAKAGGFTTVIMMANTDPVIDNVETLEYVLDKGSKTGIKVKACANITKGMKGLELTDMEALLKSGAVGFTDDGSPILDEDVLREAMHKAKQLDALLSFHEENPAYILSSGFNHGEASKRLDVGGADRLAEIRMIERDVKYALITKAKINIQHISTAEGVELVRQGKMQGGYIFAEATPHHFSLTEEDVVRYGTYAKMNPPVRTEMDRQAIIAGLSDGTIDMIATDHAPHTEEEKSRGVELAPSGIIGLETSLGLGVTKLIRSGALSMNQLITRMSYNPAKIYGLEAGTLEVGKPADIVIFNASESWRVPSHFASKASNSPFIGWELYGKVEYTICNGEIVYSA